jgi:ribonuclease HI
MFNKCSVYREMDAVITALNWLIQAARQDVFGDSNNFLHGRVQIDGPV